MKLPGIYSEIADERQRQDAMWGPQNHPDGTGEALGTLESRQRVVRMAKHTCDVVGKQGKLTWYHIMNEEWCEALVEDDPLKLRKELVQCAAVIVAWLEAIDRRLVNGDV